MTFILKYIAYHFDINWVYFHYFLLSSYFLFYIFHTRVLWNVKCEIKSSFQTMDDTSVDKVMDPSIQDVIFNIPDDIRPKMTSYRLEVIFWGVRDMKKINYTPVLNPRIIVECAAVQVKSEVMENARKFCNYKEPHVIVELVTFQTLFAIIVQVSLLNAKRCFFRFKCTYILRLISIYGHDLY